MASRPKSSTDIQIRPAVADEAAAVASVLYQAFVEYKSLYTPAAFEATTPAAEQIRIRWHEGPVWVAVQNDRIVGTVAAAPDGEALYIRSMAILPIARGQGLGRLLLNHVEAFARERGYLWLSLCTTPFLHAAIRLYERFGFQRSSEGPNELLGTPLFTMVKPLKSGDQLTEEIAVD